MLVPISIRRIAVAAALLALAGNAFAKPKKEKPEAHILLDSVGFPGFSARQLSEGASVLTVNFADDTHLLVTYGTRGLVKRQPGEERNADDRMVAAVLVNIPTGAIVARTEWLMHDHGRYLWPLGNGRFLLRIKNSLSTFAPAVNLKGEHSFNRVVFAAIPGAIDSVYVATDDHFILINSSKLQPAKPEAKVLSTKTATLPSFASNAHQLPPRISASDDAPSESAVVHSAEVLSFFRFHGDGTSENPVTAVPAGTAFASTIVGIPIYSDGYLRPVSQDRYQWHIDFHSFSGKDFPLPAIDTSCAPNMTRVGPAQFLALACRGMTAGTMAIAYDLAEHTIWMDPLPESDVPAAFAVAPSAGRFALSRVTTTTSVASPTIMTTGPVDAPTTTTNQDLRIYQTQTGDLLLRDAPSPAFPSGENFDLSSDGLQAAIVHDVAIDIYRLPNLTKGDKEDLADLAAVTPPPSSARIVFSGMPGVTVIAPTSPAVSPANPPNVVVMGDTNKPTKPPSLLTGGEKAEYPEKPAHKPEVSPQ